MIPSISEVLVIVPGFEDETSDLQGMKNVRVTRSMSWRRRPWSGSCRQQRLNVSVSRLMTFVRLKHTRDRPYQTVKTIRISAYKKWISEEKEFLHLFTIYNLFASYQKKMNNVSFSKDVIFCFYFKCFLDLVSQPLLWA